MSDNSVPRSWHGRSPHSGIPKPELRGDPDPGANGHQRSLGYSLDDGSSHRSSQERQTQLDRPRSQQQASGDYEVDDSQLVQRKPFHGEHSHRKQGRHQRQDLRAKDEGEHRSRLHEDRSRYRQPQHASYGLSGENTDGYSQHRPQQRGKKQGQRGAGYLATDENRCDLRRKGLGHNKRFRSEKLGESKHQYCSPQLREPSTPKRYPGALSPKEIINLSRSMSDQVVQTVVDNGAGFLKAFSDSKSSANPNTLKSLIKIIYLLVKSKEDELAAQILGQIYCIDAKCGQFCFRVDTLIKRMPAEIDYVAKEENLTYLSYLLDIGIFGIEKVPRTMLDTFPKATLIGTIDALQRNGEDVHILQTKCQQLKTRFELQEQVSHPQHLAKGVAHHDELKPPNDFTIIKVLPQNDDLKSGANFKPFLRPNITKGGYESWDHYLDIQFRLLREDFIAPLREGIQSHYEGLANHTPEIRVYEHVHVLTPVCLFTGMGFQISFSVKRFRNTNWEHSRRLIFGSLLCLSNNEFHDDSIVFATVVKRDPKLLAEGYLTIKFEGGVSGFHINPTDEYTMVESTAYFEAYRHVLLGLQSASQMQETMPFKRYIVDCNMKDLPLALHIRTKTSTCFDLSMPLGTKSNEARNITISEETTWPHHRTTCLDESQYEALKMALRQEISVIQGPPGTGKTYIGLKLVQAFLHNRTVWDPQKNSPILVVCYTNHALDQFLQDIIELYQEKETPDIVRVGGRCKNDKLSKFVLATKVLALREERLLPKRMQTRRIKARNAMDQLKVAFDTLQQEMNQKLLPLSVLENVMDDVHYLQISQGMPTQAGKEMEVWLKLWYPSESDTTEPQFEHTPQELIDDESNPNDELINVDEEARLLQDERMLAGEEVLNVSAPALTDVMTSAFTDMNDQKGKTEETKWKTVQISDAARNRKIKAGFCHKPMKEKDVQSIEDVRYLNEEERWKLYHYWVSQYLNLKKRHLKNPAEYYNEACNEYNGVKEETDCHVASHADIIGMTTTGAAKHHHILKSIHPKIVIIEEAAEVFESHVITSLSPSVQQLILIGDHKQLRPKPNCYELEKKYDLHVSLFERLIKNGIAYVNLTVQHRMRPDFASLICPSIYRHLENGPTALEHDKHNIGGVGYNLFFINHSFPEKRQNPGESFSHVNIHEASFMVSLCRYLLKQGHNQTQITLLTMYRGQLMEMKRRMKRAEFEGVRVAAVDDFQGEENDIILLSLVRSNSDGNIGFLKIENRVCVSLSRARKGFYVIGNFSMLKTHGNSVWPQILSVVNEMKCIGDALPLQCQIHPDQTVLAKVPEDFSKCPEGGCRKLCSFRLTCGHGCTLLCHPWGRDHKFFNCLKVCEKVLPCHHKCQRKCYECADGCAPCIKMVEKTHKCGHSMMLPCHKPITDVPCTHQCEKILKCHHFCQAQCSQPCTPQCLVNVMKTLPCGHDVEVACYLEPKDVVCPLPCDTLLQCLHSCVGTCGRCQQGRLHVHCEAACGRTLVCGHICTFPCPAECPPCLQRCRNYCPHSKCPKNCYEPCQPCAEPCEWNCKHLKCTKKCGELCNRPPCNEPCLKRLPCGHPCIGLCGEKCPQLCRVCNRKEVVKIVFGNEDEPDSRFVELQDCTHIFEYTALDQWMETQENEVQFKRCPEPECKTLIRTSLRYYNQIKRVHNDFEEIKRTQLDVSKDTPGLLAKLQDIEKKSRRCREIFRDLQKIKSLLDPLSRPRYILPHCLSAVHTQLSILPAIEKMYTALAQVRPKCIQFGDNCTITTEIVHRDIERVQRFLMQESLTDQQLSDIDSEMKRLQCLLSLLELHSKIKGRKVVITPIDQGHLDSLASRVYHSGAGTIPRVSEDLEKDVTELIADFKKQYSIEGLTETERTQIVKAVNLSKGHWFKCPNGHFYCIGECGGATEEAKCPECGAGIGGTNHTLRSDNQLAPEMDGAQHAAWSTAADMENYLDLQDQFV